MWIYLFRHGIAWDRDDPMCPPDVDRPLTPKGINRTRAAARGLARLNLTFDRVWVSPYLRAQQTLDEASDALDLQQFEKEVFEDMSPLGSVSSFMKRVRATQSRGLFCVGHAPQMDDVVQEAMHARNGSIRLKKAGLAALWYEDSQFRLKAIYPPDVLRRLGKLT